MTCAQQNSLRTPVLRKNFIRDLRVRSSRPLTAYGMGIRESSRPAGQRIPGSQGIDYTSISVGWVFGRKLDQKHGARPGSFFQAGRNAAENAQMGGDFINSLLRDPSSTATTIEHKVFGPVVRLRLPNGAGAQFTESGEFIGVLEPFTRR